MDPEQLIRSTRVRVRHDYGDRLVIDGVEMTVKQPDAMVRVGAGLLAEVVVDLPDTIVTFPFARWGDTAQALLELGWRRTLNEVPPQINELQADGEPTGILQVTGEAPYITAWALHTCESFRHPEAPTVAALVAVPTPDMLLVCPFRDPSRPGEKLAAAVMKVLAEQAHAECEPKRAISSEVFLAVAGRPFELQQI